MRVFRVTRLMRSLTTQVIRFSTSLWRRTQVKRFGRQKDRSEGESQVERIYGSYSFQPASSHIDRPLLSIYNRLQTALDSEKESVTIHR